MSDNARGMDRRELFENGGGRDCRPFHWFLFSRRYGDDVQRELRQRNVGASGAGPIVFNAWIHVGTDDFVTILIDKSEMGQSILTGLAMIAADELDCDWEKVRTEFAPADKVYFNPRFGVQGTGGSSGTPTSWNPLRKASATARAMLLEAAAQKWGVDASQCSAENSVILHARPNDALPMAASRKQRLSCPFRGCSAQNSGPISPDRQGDEAARHAG